MLQGIFDITFSSSQGSGRGIVVVDGAAVHGGDADYIYKGKFRYDDKGGNSINAEIDVSNYSGKLNSVLGNVKSERLTLNGITSSPEHFHLSGQIKGKPGAMINIVGKKQSSLVDE